MPTMDYPPVSSVASIVAAPPVLTALAVTMAADSGRYVAQTRTRLARSVASNLLRTAFGVVHRDLGPANLFLSRRADGSLCVNVLDFGTSKLSNASKRQAPSDYGMTRAATLLGSRSGDCNTNPGGTAFAKPHLPWQLLVLLLRHQKKAHRPSLAFTRVTLPTGLPLLSSDLTYAEHTTICTTSARTAVIKRDARLTHDPRRAVVERRS